MQLRRMRAFGKVSREYNERPVPKIKGVGYQPDEDEWTRTDQPTDRPTLCPAVDDESGTKTRNYGVCTGKTGLLAEREYGVADQDNPKKRAQLIEDGRARTRHEIECEHGAQQQFPESRRREEKSGDRRVVDLPDACRERRGDSGAKRRFGDRGVNDRHSP